MALPTIGDGEQIGDGNVNETLKLGRASQPLAFFGATGTTQIASLATIGPAVLATQQAFGLTTTQLTALITDHDLIIANLKLLGLMKTP